MRKLVSAAIARFRSTFDRPGLDTETDEEFRFHLDMETDRHIRAGLTPQEARKKAVIAFGGVERHRESLRRGRRVPILEPLWRDLVFGARGMRRHWGISLIAVLTIAIGTGATSTVFTAVRGLLGGSEGSSRLVTIQERRSGAVSTGLEGMLIPYDRFVDYRARTADTFEGLAASRTADALSLRLPERTIAVAGELTSGNYFVALGVEPAMGRWFTSVDAAEVVISWSLWREHFSASPDVIGSLVGLEGASMVIVGVAPPTFGGVSLMEASVWAPLGLRGDDRTAWNNRVVPVGRLAAGLTAAAAQTRIDQLAREIPPAPNSTVHGAELNRAGAVPANMRTGVTGFLGLLMAMAAFVLLIAAANIAGVLLARGVSRRRELAVRVAIGAGRGRIVRHLLAESFLISIAGAALGLVLAAVSAGALNRMPVPPQAPPLLLDYRIDLQVAGFSILVTAVAAMVFGVIPALIASRPNLVSSLKAGNSGVGGRGGLLRKAFAGTQVALATTLILTAGLFARSLQNGLASDMGMDTAGVVAARVNLGFPLDYGRTEILAFQDELLSRMTAIPEVTSAAISGDVPLSGTQSGGPVRSIENLDDGAYARYQSVGPDYFRTLGIEIVQGRAIDASDTSDTDLVAVVDQVLAEALWPGENPIGRVINGSQGSGPMRIVGVAAYSPFGTVTENPTGILYRSITQQVRSSFSVLVRAPDAEERTLAELSSVVRDLEADVALGKPARLSEMAAAGLLPYRLASTLVGLFGAIGLLLAGLGVYGQFAYQIVQRTSEIGIRRALGATAADVRRDVVLGALAITLSGCLVGVGLGVGLGVLSQKFLYGVRPTDPGLLLGITAVLFLLGVIASIVPAVRAARIEALTALRAE